MGCDQILDIHEHDLTLGGNRGFGGAPESGGRIAIGGADGTTVTGGGRAVGGTAGGGGDTNSRGVGGTGTPVATGGRATGGAREPLGGMWGSGGSTVQVDSSPVCFAPIQYDADGGVIRYGASDPAQSVVLEAGGFYAPSPELHGYCFSVSDSTDDNPTAGTSTVDPTCGKTGPCFTAASGLCATAHIDKANGPSSWGVGVGCNLAQAPTAGAQNTYTSLPGKTSMTIAVSGCKIPDSLQMQLNVGNPPMDNAGRYGDGYFCKVVTLSVPDALGVRSATFQLSDLMQDCWNGSGLMFDVSTMIVTAMQIQISAEDSGPTSWDFCISKWTID